MIKLTLLYHEKRDKIKLTILHNKVIVRHNKHNVLLVSAAPRALLGRDNRDTLPLLVKKARVILTTVVEAEAAELVVVINIQEGAHKTRLNSVIESNLISISNASIKAVILSSGDVSGVRDVKDVDVAVQDSVESLTRPPLESPGRKKN